MTDPFEDSWGDLAAEFGIDAPKPAPKLAEPEALAEMPSDFEPAPADLAQSLFGDTQQAEALPESLPDANDEDGGDTEVMEAGGDEAEKKRRRRRRRRGKKSDTPAVAGEPVEVEADEPDTVDDTTSQPSELLRDIISKWDVPSWEEIVTGLHRPNR